MARSADESAAAEARRRRDEFHFDYGNQHQFEADVLRDCLIATHAFLSEIAGEMAADDALDSLTRAVFTKDVSPGAWRAVLEEYDGHLFSDLPMGQVFHDLNAYAYHGVALTSGATADEREAYIRGLLERASHFEALIPFAVWGIDGGDLSRTLMLAHGRWALDHGDAIEPQALAIFGGVSERRIRNMMSRTEALFSPKDGRIPADQALDWLRGKPKHFRPSLWQAQDPDEPLDLEPGRLEQVVFVPVGADGSFFHPGLKRQGVFLLGAGAEDIKVTKFEDALAELQAMVTPVWRRPAGRELWTRVQGIRWERMTMELLEEPPSG